MTQAFPGTPSLKEQEEAFRGGRILGFQCSACRTRRLTPLASCPCGKGPVERTEFATQGLVETLTVQFVAAEQFMNEVPFAWVIVLLDDGGPRVSGWVPFVAAETDLPVGSRVRFSPSYKPGMRFERVDA